MTDFGHVSDTEFVRGLEALTRELGLDGAKAFIETAANRRLEHRGEALAAPEPLRAAAPAQAPRKAAAAAHADGEALGAAIRDVAAWAKRNPERATSWAAFLSVGAVAAGAVMMARRAPAAVTKIPGHEKHDWTVDGAAAAMVDIHQSPGPKLEAATTAVKAAAAGADKLVMSLLANGVEGGL